MTTTTNHDDDRHCVERVDQAVAALRARAKAAGFTIHIVQNAVGITEFVVVRWGMSKALPDVAAVAAFLDRAGGTK